MGIHVSFVRLKEEKLLEIKDNGDKVLEFLQEQARIENNPRDLWIEKTWEGFYYLLYGKQLFNTKGWAEWGTLLAGNLLTDELDTGFGFPSYQIRTVVKQIAELLQSITKEELKKRYDYEKFSKLEIYPKDDKWEEEDIDYFFPYWDDLVEFYKSAANEDELVIIYYH